MNETVKLPGYVKATILIIGVFAVFTILYLTRNIVVPVVLATIIAIVLHPVVNFFVRLRINRVISIVITLLLTFIVMSALGALVLSQASRFGESLPLLMEKFTVFINQTITDASTFYNINPEKIHEWILKAQGVVLSTSSAAVGQTLVILGSALVVFFLLPVYIFLILFYQPLLLEFIHRLFGHSNKSKVTEIVSQIKTVIQRYLTGLVIEAVLVAILDTLALLIIGIEYALLLGIIGALLNVIPYIGGLVAVALPMIVALATKSSPVSAFYVLAAYYFIQLVDNNFIVPKIVASKVKINALFSIIVVIAGNALWGIPGMFLSIPLLAIVKLIFDHIEPLKPIGFLLGDTMPPIIKITPGFRKSSFFKRKIG